MRLSNKPVIAMTCLFLLVLDFASWVRAEEPRVDGDPKAARVLTERLHPELRNLPKTFAPKNGEEIIALLLLFAEKPPRDLTDQEVLDILTGAGAKASRRPAPAGRMVERNTELPLFSPLREPAQYPSWEESTRQRFQARINQTQAKNIVEAMAADGQFAAAVGRIARAEALAIAKAQVQEFNEAAGGLNALWRKNGLRRAAEVRGKSRSDRRFREASRAVISGCRQRADEAKVMAMEESRADMGNEIGKFFQRHPEFKNQKP